MHRYRTIAQISLILSILNLALAAPIVAQEIHGARMTSDTEIVAPDVVAMPKNSGKLKAVLDMPTPPPSFPDEMPPPRHSSLSGELGSSGHYSPHLSSDGSVSGYSWLLERPPRLSLDIPESSQSASLHPSSSGPSVIPNPGLLHHAPGPNSPSSGSSISVASTPSWLLELEEVFALNMNLYGTSTETHSPGEKFTPTDRLSSVSSASIPSTKFASASGGSLTSHYFSASDGLSPLHNSISEAPSSPGPPEDAKFLTENMVKKLKIAGGVTFISALIAGIAFPLIKHREYQES